MKLHKSSLAVATEASPVSGGAFISERLRNPAEALVVKNNAAGDKIGGICAIIATLIMAIITFLLYTNWSILQSA